MALITKTFPGVFGGVSNQEHSLRKDNQVTEMINCIPSLVAGTIRRAPVESEVVKLHDDVSFIYDYTRDNNESHIIACNSNGELSAFTLGEGEKTVTIDDDAVTTYLAHNDPKSLSGITLGDITYIVNSEKVVTNEYVDVATMPELDEMYLSTPGDIEIHKENVAYYWLSRSSNDVDHKYRYVVELDGDQYSYDSDKSDDAASALAIGETTDGTAVQIKKNGDAIDGGINGQDGWYAEAVGSVVRINKTDYSDFTFAYWDSWGSRASFGWKYDVGKIQDLPASFPWDGAVVRVNSKDGDLTTNYYLMRWKGAWREFTTIVEYDTDGEGNNIRKLLLPKNMPIVIERLSDGNFKALLLKTKEMLRPPLVGNTDNNKDPNFIGKTIKQIFYMNDRICIISGDSLTFSETGLLWNFYVKTVINLLDDDSLEASIASEKVVTILRVGVFQNGLLIMTTEGQYLFNTENGISPSTVYISKLSNYSYSDDGGTLYDGDSIVFSGITGDTSRLYRYRVARLTSENKALDLTIQVPKYILGKVQQLKGYTEDGTIIVRVNNEKFLYLYKEVVSGDQIVQSSWFKWDFSNFVTDTIDHCMVIEDYLYFICKTDVYKIPLGLKFDITSYKDLTTTDFTSSIELTKWRPKKTQSQIQTSLGRMQIRTIDVDIKDDVNLKIHREARNKDYIKKLRPYKSATILGDSEDTILYFESIEDKPFTIGAYTLTGTYVQRGQDSN